jgi:hypothetical protein
MEDLSFHWGEPLDDTIQHLNAQALKDLCQSFIAKSSCPPRTRKDMYVWIESQDMATQRRVSERVNDLLAAADPGTCKKTWILKRKREDEEGNIKAVRARLDILSTKLFPDGGQAGTIILGM